MLIFSSFLEKKWHCKTSNFILEKAHISSPHTHLFPKVEFTWSPSYPNTTHILQPIDISLFQSIIKGELAWLWSSWSIKGTRPQVIKKRVLHHLLLSDLTEISPEVIINGFRDYGLCQCSVDAINVNKNSSLWKWWKQEWKF